MSDEEICPIDASHTPRERRRIARSHRARQDRPDWDELSPEQQAMINAYGWPESQR